MAWPVSLIQNPTVYIALPRVPIFFFFFYFFLSFFLYQSIDKPVAVGLSNLQFTNDLEEEVP